MSMVLADLQQVFSTSEWPEFLALNTKENCLTLHIRVSPDIYWLTGHFPEQPVLAGVVQTHWAAELGQYAFALEEGFQRIDNLKFHSVILPGQELDLTLQYSPETRSIRFSYQSASTPLLKTSSSNVPEKDGLYSDGLYSEGKLVF